MSLWHTIYRVDWAVVLDLYSKGTLVETLLDDDTPDWAEPYSEMPLSYNLYCAVADAYAELRPGLTDNTRQNADDFILPLIIL
ncbi:MAG: hypothetical protein F6K09_04360 [Merismopedia sp. SIO2A8]|nr:hypothetical protein [Merismopedia sp. SIO2A8]